MFKLSPGTAVPRRQRASSGVLPLDEPAPVPEGGSGDGDLGLPSPTGHAVDALLSETRVLWEVGDPLAASQSASGTLATEAVGQREEVARLRAALEAAVRDKGHALVGRVSCVWCCCGCCGVGWGGVGWMFCGGCVSPPSRRECVCCNVVCGGRLGCRSWRHLWRGSQGRMCNSPPFAASWRRA
jgi:hypothetical protein